MRFELSLLALPGVAAVAICGPSSSSTTSVGPTSTMDTSGEYTGTSAADIAACKANSPTTSKTSFVEGKMWNRIVTIFLENQDYATAAADPNMQFFSSLGITLDNYYACTHPSEPNYACYVGGDYYGMDNDDYNLFPSNVSTLVDLLEEKDVSWAVYQEDMPCTGYEAEVWTNPATGLTPYRRKHNPVALYDSVVGRADRLFLMKNFSSVDFTESMFHKDLANRQLPQWMFLTPNMTNDAHDSSMAVAGNWLRGFLDPLLNDTYFMNDTLVIITFDENAGGELQNRVYNILLSDAFPTSLHGTTDSGYYSHYSHIATVESNWDLNTLGRFDVGANVFSPLANVTGEKLRTWGSSVDKPPFEVMFFATSYAGHFSDNAAPDSNRQLPAPNVNLVGPSGRKVSPAIVSTWNGSTIPTYYGPYVEVPDGFSSPTGYAPFIFNSVL